LPAPEPVAAPSPPVAAPPPPAAEPAAPPPRRAERGAPVETLRLATTLPSLDRVRTKNEPAGGNASLQTPAVDKTVSEPDPRIQAEADVRSARELLAQGKRAEAEQYLKQALARMPSQTEAAMTLARLQVDRGDLGGAWDTLQRSLPFAQQQATYHAFCGTVLQRLNRSREAVDHYQAALRLNPAEGRWWVGLGIALEGTGKAVEAREAFQRGRAAGNLPPEMAAFAEQKSR
jgi:MSHA biogenesis protein MshN